MDNLSNVQQKIACVFETRVVEEPSGKRSFQPYKVVAGEKIRQEAEQSDILNALPTEKLDGTCVYVAEFDGIPWLWARHDRKPSKHIDRKFKKYQNTHRGWIAGGKVGKEPEFPWDLNSDFKDVPHEWIPAAGVPKNAEDIPLPDSNGHIPGWVPIDHKGRQHCWHATSVDLDTGIALVLHVPDDRQTFQISAIPLSELVGSTLELIGTHINGNPYKIGSKQAPLHLLVRHGAVSFQNNPPLDYAKLSKWFSDDEEGQVEGIVWHCSDGKLFKIHRHHVGLKWPVENTTLQNRPVKILVNVSQYSEDLDPMSNFCVLGNLFGQQFSSLGNIPIKNTY